MRRFRIGLPLLPAALAALLLAGCADDPACTTGPATTLAVRFPTGALPVVDASLNGASVPMVIDTGASASFVTPQAVRRVGLPVSKTKDITGYGAGGPTKSPTAEISDLRLGPHVQGRIRMPVTSLTDGATARQVYLGGVLGNNILGRFDLDLDLPRSRITMTPTTSCTRAPAVAPASATAPRPIRYRRAVTGSPEFPVTIDGIRVEAILDSGSTRTVMPRSLFDKSGLAARASGPIATIGTLSAGGRLVPLRFYQLGDARIGGIAWSQPVIGVGGDTGRIGDFLIVGNDFLRYHRVVIHRRSHTLVIHPEA